MRTPITDRRFWIGALVTLAVIAGAVQVFGMLQRL